MNPNYPPWSCVTSPVTSQSAPPVARRCGDTLVRRRATRAVHPSARPTRATGVTTVTTSSSPSLAASAPPSTSSAPHEQVVFCHDRETGLRAVIGIYSTALGPALGGTRFYPYASEEAAVADVLRLSKGMAYKN